MQLAERALSLPGSAILSLVSECRRRKAMGEEIVDLSLGESNFETPIHIAQAAARAIADGHTRYTPPAGLAPLRVAVRRSLAAEGSPYGPREVMVTCGATGALLCAFQTILSPGDEVLLPQPYYPSYLSQIGLAGGVAVPIPTRDGHELKLTPEALRAAMTPRTRLLVLNNPTNPTGAVYGRDELERLAQVCLESDLIVLADEVYCALVYGDKHVSFASLGPEMRRRTLLVRSFSKTYAMTGWRVGFAAGPEPVIRAMTAVQESSVVTPCSISQWAALEALTASQDCVAQMRVAFDGRRRLVLDRLRPLSPNGEAARGAFFVFPRLVGAGGDAAALCASLLKSHGVALVPGREFGMPSHARISYGVPMDQLRDGLDRLERGLAQAKHDEDGSAT